MERNHVTYGTGLLIAFQLAWLLAAPGCGGSGGENTPCDGVDCSGHGHCWNQSGQPWCECDAGYHDEGLACIKDLDPCDGEDCGGHGRCEAHTGFTSCTCDPGYQDHDGDNVCQEDCATAALACSPQATCTDETGTAVCVCPPGHVGASCDTCATGYEPVGDACVWGQHPRDSGFELPDAWTASAGAFVDTLADGFLEPGAGVFDATAACNAGTLSQTFEMPAFDESEPMLLQIHSRREPCEDCPFIVAQMARINGFPFPWYMFFWGSWDEVGFCLGEAAYGGPLTIGLSRVPPAMRCETPADVATLSPILVDDVTVSPATEGFCPRPGEVLNGDFEAGWTGWENASPDASEGIEILEDTSSGRNKMVSFTVDRTGDNLDLRGRLSVPLALDAPALELVAGGTPGGVLKVSAWRTYVGEIVAGGSLASGRLCLPAWTRGVAFDVFFSVYGCDLSLLSCEAVAERQLLLDDLRLVNEPRCGAEPLLDGGFEMAAQGASLTRSWTFSRGPGGSYLGGRAEIRVEPESARTGEGTLRLEVTSPCSMATAEASFRDAEAVPGRAVSFWYRTQGFVDATFLASVGPAYAELPPSDDWVRRVICLSPDQAGLINTFYIMLSGGEGACETIRSERAWIDDVEVNTDPSCLP